VSTTATQTLLATNREKYTLFRDGVLVTFQNEKGERLKHRLRVFDFDEPLNNHFLCVRELWIRGDLYRRRPDIVGFVNGLPLLFMEFKNIGKDICSGYERNFKDYTDTIPHIFHHNAVLIFGNGRKAKLGSITSRWEHFHEWKRLAEREPGVVEMETLLRGLCQKGNFMDLFENFIAFDDSLGETKKIIARNHQFLGVNRALEAIVERRERKGKAWYFLAYPGVGEELLDALFYAQGASQAWWQLHLPDSHRP
jgi:type I restriction enzyme, R subunit